MPSERSFEFESYELRVVFISDAYQLLTLAGTKEPPGRRARRVGRQAAMIATPSSVVDQSIPEGRDTGFMSAAQAS